MSHRNEFIEIVCVCVCVCVCVSIQFLHFFMEICRLTTTYLIEVLLLDFF